jgi:hypothetical protein
MAQETKKIRKMCSTIICCLSPHFLLIFFCMPCLFLLIDGIKLHGLFLCVYESLNHAKNTFMTCTKALFFVFFETITKCTFLYSIIKKLMTWGADFYSIIQKIMQKYISYMDRYSYVLWVPWDKDTLGTQPSHQL